MKLTTRRYSNSVSDNNYVVLPTFADVLRHFHKSTSPLYATDIIKLKTFKTFPTRDPPFGLKKREGGEKGEKENRQGGQKHV